MILTAGCCLQFATVVSLVLVGCRAELGQSAVQSTPSLFERIRSVTLAPANQSGPALSEARAGQPPATTERDYEDSDVGEPDEEEDLEEDGDNDDDDDDEAELAAVDKLDPKSSEAKILLDMFGNKIKLENNRTILVSQNKARDLGLLAVKAIILGPLIGLTLKAALIRGLFWAVGAYLLHLFFPALLSTLGLGTGLVGFARQLQPDYMQMLLPQLANLPSTLHHSLPGSLSKLTSQYALLMQPLIEALGSIPEGHCRYRAVCETASHLIRNTQSMSTSLQRLSASVYLNFGTEYSKAWLDGIVQSDCAAKYAQCPSSPFAMLANRLAEALRPKAA